MSCHIFNAKLKDNQTFISEVILLGFQTSKTVSIVLFIQLFFIYCLTLCGNLLIVMLVSYSKTLHTPMYFFIAQLSITDIMLTTDITPKLLHILLKEGKTMFFTSCIFQYYVFVVTEYTEFLLLTVMSYDRFLAICNPLHYTSIMNRMHLIRLTILSWLMSIITMIGITISVACLDFCGPNVIDHFYCDILPLLNLSCSDTFMVHLELMLISVPVLFIPFLLILISYSYVIFTILKITSTTGKRKAFSTCSSHLTVVCIYYVIIIFNYILPTGGQSKTASKLLSLLYTMGTPLFNPLIYSLRNEDIKKAFNTFLNYFHFQKITSKN
ncbi:olfactory receptor 10A3-like [Gastrophryne carolinensis]